MTAIKTSPLLLFLLFMLIPFQRRFHGAVDSFSRSLSLPAFPLPEYFSTKIHLYLSDVLILLLVATLFWIYKAPLRTFFWEGPSKYLTLLLLACLTSICCSVTAGYALSYFRLLQLAFPVLLFCAIRFLSQKIDFLAFLQRLSWILVIVCTLECFIGTIQYFSQHSLGLSFLGEKSLHHFPFPNPGGQRWFFDQFLPNGQSLGHLFRASGTFSHPNILGGFIFCSVMASYFLLVQPLYKWKKGVLLTCLLLQFFTLFIAFSRSAMIALLLASLFWCLLQLKQRGASSSVRKVIYAMLTCMALCTCLFYSQLIARGGVINYNVVTKYADSERLQYMQMAWDMFQEHPLLGVGWNNFQLHIATFQGSATGHLFFSKVHNIYLLVLAETGLIGAVLFVLFLSFLLRAAWKSPMSQAKIFLLSTFIGLLFIGQCDFYLLDTPQGNLLFFGIAGLLCAAARVDNFVLKH